MLRGAETVYVSVALEDAIYQLKILGRLLPSTFEATEAANNAVLVCSYNESRFIISNDLIHWIFFTTNSCFRLSRTM